MNYIPILKKIFLPSLLLLLNLNVFTAIAADYQAPIGIPNPSFGINESYRMYDVVGNRNGSLTYTQNAEGGFYTHYVDNTNPNCAETINNGTAATPLCYIPYNLPAGSIVEVHGGTKALGPSGEVFISGVGTKEMPIFIRGVNMPRMERSVGIGFYGNAKYLVLEGMSFFGGTIDARRDTAGGGEVFETSYISVRNCDFHGGISGGGLGISAYSSNAISNIVLYNDKFHDFGDKTSTDQSLQAHGITINQGSYIWLLNSEVYNNGGSGIQVNAGTNPTSIARTHHIYIGRNSMHDNKQPSAGFKQSSDIIISQNDFYASDPTVTGLGGLGQGCGGYQYGPERLWFIFNHCHGTQIGFFGASPDTPVPGQNYYFIGNVINNIHHYAKKPNDPTNPWEGSGTALINWGGYNRNIVNNTIYDVDAGINSPDSGTWLLENNIISNVTQANHIFFSNPSLWNFNHNLFTGSVKINIAYSNYDVGLLQTSFSQAKLNKSGDPLFADAANENFHLSASSPAIDAGSESEVYQIFQDLYGIDIRVDFDGNPRPQSGSWDIGAFEFGVGSASDVVSPVLISPYGGSFSSAQYVVLSTNTAFAQIHYTLDGSVPTAASPLYSGTILVSSSKTIKAMAVKAAMANSGVSSATFSILIPVDAVAAVAISPNGGSFSSAQNVTLSSSTPGAEIRYTIDGSLPTAASLLFSGAISIASSKTIKAIGIKSGLTNSSVVSATFTITIAAADVPNTNGWTLKYVDSEDTLTNPAAYAFDNDPTTFWHTAFRENAPPPPHEIQINLESINSINGFNYLPRQDGSFNGYVGQYEFYVSLDGVNWGSAVSTGVFLKTKEQKVVKFTAKRGQYIRLKGLTDASGGPYMSVAELGVSVDTSIIVLPEVATVAISPIGGSFTSAQSVTMSTSTVVAEIRYTKDGSMPNSSSLLYSGAIIVDSSQTIKAIGISSGMSNSIVSSADFMITLPPALVSSVAISPNGGSFSSIQSVTLSSSTVGAEIRYTLDGSTPTATSLLYSSAISIAASKTIKAIGIKSGMSNSLESSAAFIITLPLKEVVASVAISPADGIYYSAQKITMISATVGARIRYTLNGNTPTSSSPLYSGPFIVSSSKTIKAIAIKSGMTNSKVVTRIISIKKLRR